MSLATRLVLGLGVVVVLVMTIYGITSLRHREELARAAVARETETLGQALRIVAASALRNQQAGSLDRVLGRIVRDPEMEMAAVVDPAYRLLAGGPRDLLPCVANLLPRPAAAEGVRLWAECGRRLRLIALPLEEGGAVLVLARNTSVLDRDMAASRRRILLTTLALAALAALAILLVLRRALTEPLSQVLAGVRQLGGPTNPRPIPVPRAARELRELAMAFNEMVERLEGKRLVLIRETEERVELERRLRQAETFAAVGRVTGGIAHELGSPLGVIGVRAEAIRSDPGAGAAAHRHAEEISAEVDRIARLVRDLMHVARHHGPLTGPVDLVAVVGAAVDDARRAAEPAGVRLEVDLPSRPVTVPGDGTLLRHALHNLLDNAIQALRRHAGERLVRVHLQPAGGVARLLVEDTGPGIDPEHYPHVLEPFFTTKDVGEGSGLGLAIASGIAEEHGGTLTLVPAPGGGVRAFLDLPAMAPSPENR